MSKKITVTTEEDGRIVVFEGSGTLELIERSEGWVDTRPASMSSREVRGVEIVWDGVYMVREADRQNRTLEELRERIAEALRRETDNGGSRTEDYAQAVIDELGLTREEEWVEPRAGSTTKFAPLTLDALREAWENAEVPTKDNPIREGDELIVKHREEGWEWVAICPGSDSENWISDARVLHRAPRREPWEDLADVLAVEMPGIEDEPRIEALAKALYCEHDVRVTDGDDDE